MATILNCEDELIHLCGKIQNFGYLLVFNVEHICVAISDNCDELFLQSASTLLNEKTSFFEEKLGVSINMELEHLKKNDSINKIDFYKVSINKIDYQLSVYIEDTYIFLEFEKNTLNEIDLNILQELQLKIDDSSNLWQSLCDNFYEVIGFDRIMVYKFLDDGTGIVVAESINGALTPVLGYRYPEFDIPSQARSLYAKNLNRQTPDIYADPVLIIGLNATKINLSKSKIRAMSPFHLQYLKNTGVTASASFSIIIDDKLWGLVCCQHQSHKYITIEERKLGTFLINSVANKYHKNKELLVITQNEFIKEIEFELKEKLYYSHNLFATLNQFVNRFLYVLSAKGAIIVSPNSIFKSGKVPSDSVFEFIENDLNTRLKHKPVYTTHNYSNTKRNRLVDTEDCAGIARIKFDREGKYAIYFFRPEVIKEELWAGKPKKFLSYSLECNSLVYSPRNSFEMWKTEVKGESHKWTDFHRVFLDTIYTLVTDSLFRKVEEDRRLDSQLAIIKNEGDFEADDPSLLKAIEGLKNSTDFKKSAEGLSPKELEENGAGILETTILMNHIISKAIDLALDNPNNKHYNTITLENFIFNVINDGLQFFQIKKAKVNIGELHPVKGDKTLLHELFINIIFNALKFSCRQEEPRIEIYSVKNYNEVVYYIQDNGIGMNTNDKDLPFVIFKRLPNSSTYEGDGIGLAVVKRIVKRLNGEITYKSEIGVGTTFMISFSNE
jgi:two-component system, chemotaxis family, sensor kinase Cph1